MRLQFFLLTSAREPHTRPRPVSPPVSIKLSPRAGTSIPWCPFCRPSHFTPDSPDRSFSPRYYCTGQSRAHSSGILPCAAIFKLAERCASMASSSIA